MTELELELDMIRCRLDVAPSLLDSFYHDRLTDAYQAAYVSEQPLVSVCIATYNRPRLLVERSVRSVLEQTYTNFELIVVGDCCGDDTVSAMKLVTDPRLCFINLPRRGTYPADPRLRWMVAGSEPMNHALSMAKGHFITHLDDDDEYLPTRLEVLVRHVQEHKADLVWHPFMAENSKHQWRVKQCLSFAHGSVTTSSVLYHNWFRRIGWDLQAYRLHEPGDWNRFRKFRYLNAKCVRAPEALLKHYRERTA